MLFLVGIYTEYDRRPQPLFSRSTGRIVRLIWLKLIFFMNHYYRRIGRTNKTPRQFALRVNKHVSYGGKNNQDFCLFLNHALDFKFALRQV